MFIYRHLTVEPEKGYIRVNQQLVDYLLGKVSDEVQKDIEHRYLVDEEYQELMAATEDWLIEAYLRNLLSPTDCKLFKLNFSSPERINRINFIKLLIEELYPTTQKEPEQRSIAVEQQVKKSSWRSLFPGFFKLHLTERLAYSAILTLLSIGCSILYIQNSRLRSGLNPYPFPQALVEERKKLQQLESELIEVKSRNEKLEIEIATNRSLSQQLIAEQQKVEEMRVQVKKEQDRVAKLENRLNNETSIAAVVSYPLFPVNTKAGGSSPLIIPVNTRTVQLKILLDINDNYNSYDARLLSPTNDELWAKVGLKPIVKTNEQIINLNVDTGFIKRSGNYSIELTGIDNMGKREIIRKYQFNCKVL